MLHSEMLTTVLKAAPTYSKQFVVNVTYWAQLPILRNRPWWYAVVVRNGSQQAVRNSGLHLKRRIFINSILSGVGTGVVSACGGATGSGESLLTPQVAQVPTGSPSAVAGSGVNVPNAPNSAANPAGTPVWVPSEGALQTVSTANTFLSQNGNVVGWEYAFGKIVDDYSGGVYNPYWGTLGAMVFHGGGHSATFDNSVVVLDYNDLTFKRVSNPTQSANGANWTFSNMDPAFNPVYAEYGDGQPGSGHTYDTLAILPPAQGGGAMGSLVRVGSHAVHPGVVRGTTHAHRFDFESAARSAGTWTRWTVNALKGQPSGACSAYDPVRGRFWNIGGLSSQPSLIRYVDVASRENREVAFAKGAGLAPPANPDSMTMRYDPTLDLLVLSCTVGNALRLAFLRCGAPERGWTEATLSSPIPSMAQWTHPFDFVPQANKFVMFSPADTSAVFDLVVPADPAQTWQMTRQALRSGGTLKSAYVAGKRWSYSPATRCFVWMASSTSAVVAYRPVGV